MKKFTAILLSFCMIISLIILPTSVSADSPYENSEGFETGGPSFATLTNSTYLEASDVVAGVAHTGDKSYYLKFKDANYQTADICCGQFQSGKSYLVDFYVKFGDNCVSGGSFCWYLCSSELDYNSNASRTDYTLGYANSLYGWFLASTNDPEWHHYSMRVDATASQYAYLACCGMSNINCDMYIDDITVKEITSNTVCVDLKETYNSSVEDSSSVLTVAGNAGDKITYVPYKKGKLFCGYYTNKDYTERVTEFSSENTVLYAKWKDDATLLLDFEDVNDLNSGSTAGYSLNTDWNYTKSGAKSLHFESTAVKWSIFATPLTRVEAGKHYLIDFWYRLESANNNICITPVTASSSNVWSSGRQYGADFPNNNSVFNAASTLASYYTIVSSTNKGEWYRAALLYTSPGDITSSNNTLWFNLYSRTSSTELDIYFDDIRITEIDDSYNRITFNDSYEVYGNNSFYFYGIEDNPINYIPEREGYEFSGWYSDNGYENEVTAYPTSPTTLYAKWEMASGLNRITFNANGGILKDSETVIIASGEEFSVKPPVRPLKDFAGWTDKDGNIVTSVDSTCTLYASWTDEIGFESFYRSRANQMGYALHITDTYAASGTKSIVYDYNENTYVCPKLTPVFSKPDDFETAYGNYVYFDGTAPVFLKSTVSAPKYEDGKYYSYSALSEKPDNFDTEYYRYGYFDGDTFKLVTGSAPAFVAGKFYETFYGNIDKNDGFVDVGNVLDGKNYTLSFKYKVMPTSNTVTLNVFNYPIYSTEYPNVAYYNSKFTVTSANADGNWHNGSINFTANAKILDGKTSDVLGLYVTLKDLGVSAACYIDCITLTENSGASYMTGDVNGDGKINVLDYVRMKRHLAGHTVLLSEGADVNNDGVLDSKDITRIKKILLGNLPSETIHMQGSGESVLKNKLWSVVGDSLTDTSNTTAKMRYCHYVAEDTGVNITVYGMSGTGYYNGNGSAGNQFYNRVRTVSAESDIITFLGSVNDYKVVIGEIGDTDDTLCGCFKRTIEAARETAPNAKIAVISPLPAGGGSMVPWNETDTNKAHLYTEKLRELCEYYDVAFLDLYHNSIMEPYNADFNAAYFSRADGCHPNDFGHSFVAKQVEQLLESMY